MAAPAESESTTDHETGDDLSPAPSAPPKELFSDSEADNNKLKSAEEPEAKESEKAAAVSTDDITDVDDSSKPVDWFGLFDRFLPLEIEAVL